MLRPSDDHENDDDGDGRADANNNEHSRRSLCRETKTTILLFGGEIEGRFFVGGGVE